LSSEENKRDPGFGDDVGPEVGPVEDTAGPQEENPPPIESEAGDPSVPAADIGNEPAGEPDPEADGLLALSEELDATRLERDQYLDALRRLKAEFENSRKRQERDRSQIFSMASERLIQELLPVLDNLDRALEAGGDIRGGVSATRDQLAEVLANEGLLPVASDGQPFDPNVHDAVMGQPSEEHEEGTIIQTFQRGYLLNGKPIRPAKVVVAKQV
jgi:molecular chaperone GrpE